jgi:branched-chain amino acid transport system permease protein
MSEDRLSRWPAVLAFAILAFAAPILLSGNRFLSFIAGMTMLNILWASGMNLLYGYAGPMPLMFAGIAGMSAYATVYLTASLDWSFFLAMPLSAAFAAVVGTALGLPSLRLKGFYFTLCSLVIQTVLTLAFVFFSGLTNGDTGISSIPLPSIPGGGLLSGTAYDLVLSGAAALGLCVVLCVTRSEFGRRLVAIREDEGLAEMLGIRVTRCKLSAFMLASLFAGIGGALYAPYLGFISPRSFDLLTSLNIWLMVAFGGRGTLFGPVLGAVILAPVPYLLQDYYTVKDILYGGLIVVIIIFMPDGILRSLKPRLIATGLGAIRAEAGKAS